MDLSENENLLIQAEDTVTILERSCVNVPEQRQCRVDPLVRATYTDLLRLLMSTEKSAVQCNSLREEIEVYNNEVSAKLIPVNVVCFKWFLLGVYYSILKISTRLARSWTSTIALWIQWRSR